jgi:hypothetical protein
LDPAEIRVFLKTNFTIMRPQKKNEAQLGAEAASAAACAIGFYCRCAKTQLVKLRFGLGPDLTITVNFNLNMIQKNGI